MADPNYESMGQDVAVLLTKWETEGNIDIVDDPGVYVEVGPRAVRFIVAAVRVIRAFKR
jgi:hypothetical protein